MKLLMLIKTTGLVYDDRLRKEVLSLREFGVDTRIVALEYANKAGSKVVYSSIPAITIALKSRQWLPRKRGLIAKSAEMYFHFLKITLESRPDVIWLHNLELSGLVFLFSLLRKVDYPVKIVWDQHELPSDRFLNNRWFLWVYQRLIDKCDVVIMANSQRRDLVIDLLKQEKVTTPIMVLNNYPDKAFANSVRKQLPLDVQEWLMGKEYLLAQGGANPGRYLTQLIEAVFAIKDIKLLVVGPYQEKQFRNYVHRFGVKLLEHVYFTGFVPQMDLIPFIDHALGSVVLYDSSSQNNYLCAPNRLYQAVVRGTPVVVGSNPSMAEFVKRCQCGVVLSGDGADVEDIRSGIIRLRSYRSVYRQHSLQCRRKVMWESQQPIIQQTLKLVSR